MKIEIDRDTVQQAVTWADNHGEQVSFAGGMPSVYGMNEWSRPMREALAEPQPAQQERLVTPSVRSVLQQTLEMLEKFGRGESSGIPLTVLVHNLREELAAPQPSQERVIAPSVRGVMQQALDALNSLRPKHGWGKNSSQDNAIAALREALTSPQNQLDDINVAELAAPNSVEFDGIRPEQQEPVAWMLMNGVCNYQLFGSKKQADALCADMQKRHDLSGSLASFRVQPLYTTLQPTIRIAQPTAEPVVEPVALVKWQVGGLVVHIVGDVKEGAALYTAPQPAPQQKPDSLHLAAMDLARKQAQRIAELESEIAGLESGASHMSIIIDELRSLLVEVDDVFGKDGYGFPFEDGDSALIDRIRSRIESIAEPAPQLAARVPLAGDRIAELEAEVERFRQHALNEKAARQAIEQQLAARVLLQADMFWNSEDAEPPHDSIECFLNDRICNDGLEVGEVFTMFRAKKLPDVTIMVTAIDLEKSEAEYKVIEAAHGITKDPS